MQFAELNNTPKQKKTDTLITLINQSQEIRPQGLDLGRSTASNQAIANLRPRPRLQLLFWGIFQLSKLHFDDLGPGI